MTEEGIPNTAPPTAPRAYDYSDLLRAMDLSSNMVDKYVKAYEEEEGPLPRKSQRGNAPRLFPEGPFNTIVQARALVSQTPGAITVSDAMRQVLGKRVSLVEPNSVTTGLDVQRPAVEELLSQMVSLLESQGREIQSLRTEVARLREEMETRALPAAEEVREAIEEAVIALEPKEQQRPRSFFRRLLGL